MEWLGLEEHRKKDVRQLSKGTLQRLGLAQALIGDTDLVVLDEPTHGLDPLWTQRFRDIVRELRRPGRCILIASHDLDELERLADRVAILHQGRLERVVTAGVGAADEEPAVYRISATGADQVIARIFPSATPVEGRANEWRLRGRVPELNRGLSRADRAERVVVVIRAGGQPARERVPRRGGGPMIALPLRYLPWMTLGPGPRPRTRHGRRRRARGVTASPA